MIVSFDQPLPDSELDQYLADVERATLDTGFAQSVVDPAPPPDPRGGHPGADRDAIVQIAVADTDTLAKAFADPGLHEVIERWQSRHSYKVAWANHESLS